MAEKQIFPEQREKETVKDGLAACLPLTQHLSVEGWGMAGILPCELFSKDSKRKGHRKDESEERVEWRCSYHRKKGLPCVWHSWSL